jgi:hypothetical protein
MATMEDKKTGIPSSPPHISGKDTPSDTGSVDALDVVLLATEEHPAHPRNWPVAKRWAILFCLCTFQAFMYFLLF